MKTQDQRTNAAEPTFLFVEDELGEFNNIRARIRAQWPDACVVHVGDCTTKAVAREMARCERGGHPVDVILLDVFHQDCDSIEDPIAQWSGLRLLQELRAPGNPAQWLPIVACTKFGDRHPSTRDRDPGVEFLRRGGTDFIDKMDFHRPAEDASWPYRLRNHVVMSRLINPRGVEAAAVPAIHGTLEGSGRFIEDVRRRLKQFVDNGTRFLCLYGETGVGKGKAVGYVKYLLDLSDNQTAEIQLSTIPETLLEGYLFGHRKGTFTGATENRTGALEDKRLIYLDEFQRIPLHVQAKLLRVLRERYFYRVGETETRRAIDPSAIFIVSLDAPPDVLVRRGVLSPDIAGRLPLSMLEMRPLRARKDEIEDLVRVFLDRRRARAGASGRPGSAPVGIDPEAARAIRLSDFDWPYNIGQLEALVEHLCDARTSSVITCADVQHGLQHLMGSELEFALRILRRYAFNRKLAAHAWANLGKPWTTYLRDDSNMNTFCVRRVLVRVAGDVALAEDHHELRLVDELLGAERFDATLQGIVYQELVELQGQIEKAASVQVLSELVRAAPLRPWRVHLLRHKDPQVAPQDHPSRSEVLAALAKVFGYTAMPEDLLPGVGFLLACDFTQSWSRVPSQNP